MRSWHIGAMDLALATDGSDPSGGGNVPGSSRGIFLSYRREDAALYARLLQVQLSERFPDAQVFMDLDSIEAGRPFAEAIRDAVDTCAVLVALIGPKWATLTNEEGQRRLHNPGDWVRFEIREALERGIRVIPVLVDGARPPRQEQLPSDLHRLAGLNALELSHRKHYKYDIKELLELIHQVLPLPPPIDVVYSSSSTAESVVSGGTGSLLDKPVDEPGPRDPYARSKYPGPVFDLPREDEMRDLRLPPVVLAAGTEHGQEGQEGHPVSQGVQIDDARA
jgi:TIR domain